MLIEFLQRACTAPLRLLAFGIGVYQSNRDRLRVVLEKPRVRLLIRTLVVATLIAWLLIGLLYGDPHGNELNRYIHDRLPWLQGL